MKVRRRYRESPRDVAMSTGAHVPFAPSLAHWFLISIASGVAVYLITKNLEKGS